LFQGVELPWPVPQPFDFDGVYMDPFSADDDSQVVDLFFFELAFGESEEVRFLF